MLKTTKLAAKDYIHEWQLSGCYVLSLAAVLSPMMVLFGLKFGIVDHMITQLIEEPRNREIRPVGSGRYEPGWFSQLRERSDVEFVIPRTRTIAASIQLKSKSAPRILDVELIPTAKNDPLLPNVNIPPTDYSSLVLSKTAAQKLAVQPGDLINGSIARRFHEKYERVHLPLKVQAVAFASEFDREGAFVSIRLLEALEDYRDGHAVPALGWSGSHTKENGYYTGFRLYARSIYAIASLKSWFSEQGIEVRTRAGAIETVQQLDRNLSAIYWVIALIGLIGFPLSLSASLWANIKRKRTELSVLRVIGFSTADVMWFPIAQSLFTAVLGWWLAVNIFAVISTVINNQMAGQLETGYICYMLPPHYSISLALTCFTALIAALMAGFRSARIEPVEGLREI